MIDLFYSTEKNDRKEQGSLSGNFGMVDSKLKFLGTIIILGIVISWTGNQITFKIISKEQGSSVLELGSKL